MKETSILVRLAIGAALSIVALPASAQANRESVSRVEMEPHGEDRLQRRERAQPQPASASHELTHTVQQREGAVESASGSRRGVRHQQGRVITDSEYNASRPAGQPPAGMNDGTSRTVVVSETPGTLAPAGEEAGSSATPTPEVDNEALAPAQPAASQPAQTDYGFVRAPASRASDSTTGADEVTVRGWDAKSKKETADDDTRHPGTERVTDGEQ